MSELFPCAVAQTWPLDRAADIYGRLLKERIVFLGTQVDDISANLICAELLVKLRHHPVVDRKSP